MKKLLLAVLVVFAGIFTSCTDSMTLKSPDGNIKFKVYTENGSPCYAVYQDGKCVVKGSRLGFEMRDLGLVGQGFTIKEVGRDSKNETWEQPWGEQQYVVNNYNEMTLQLTGEASGRQVKFNLVVRAFDDGFGFRYEFPEQEGLEEFAITDELTEFRFTEPLEAWWMSRSEPYYEAYGQKTPIDKIDTAYTPLVVMGSKGEYYAIHEAALLDYAKMNLVPTDDRTLKAWLTPWSDGTLVYAKTPCVTPWRTMIMGRNIDQMYNSKIMLNLNEPSKIEDTSWIKPGKYIGIWWILHKDFYTWYEGPRHGATTAQTLRYIDFAAENGFAGVLVEGWNEGWAGNWMKNSTGFSFVKAYPDYDFDKIMAYANSKGVQMIIHNETAANCEHYFSQIHEAYGKYQNAGMHYIKTGNVNLLIDGKEEHDGQYGVNQLHKIVEIAADYQICVDEHEPCIPTGVGRTWPNLMTHEAVRGQEHDAWEEDGGNKPEHSTVVPFLRGLAGPMDFTFGTFDFSNPNYPFCRVRTTLAKQLAQYVVIYSPLQMASDDPSAYEGKKAFDFIKDVPCDWYETKVVDAVIGDYCVMARRDRAGEDWYLGAISDENARELSVKLDFLSPDTEYLAQIYADASDASYEENPEAVEYSEMTVNSKSSLEIRLATSGGCAVRFVKISK